MDQDAQNPPPPNPDQSNDDSGCDTDNSVVNQSTDESSVDLDNSEEVQSTDESSSGCDTDNTVFHDLFNSDDSIDFDQEAYLQQPEAEERKDDGSTEHGCNPKKRKEREDDEDANGQGSTKRPPPKC